MKRPLLKAFSYSCLHFSVVFLVAYALTGDVAVSAAIGLIEPMFNTLAFHLHERAWARLGHRKERSAAFGHDVLMRHLKGHRRHSMPAHSRSPR